MEPLGESLERPTFDCPLAPVRALGTLAETEVFLRDRGLLSRIDAAAPRRTRRSALHDRPDLPKVVRCPRPIVMRGSEYVRMGSHDH